MPVVTGFLPGSRLIKRVNVPGGSGRFRPAHAALVDGVRARSPLGGPAAAWMTSSIGNPARRRTSCRESVYRNSKTGVFGSLVIQEGFILIEAALSRENWLFPGKNQPRRAAPAAAARRARGSPSLLFQFRDDSGIDFGNFENNRRHSCLSGGRARAAVRFSGSVHCGQQPLKGFGVVDGRKSADRSLRGSAFFLSLRATDPGWERGYRWNKQSRSVIARRA